MKTFHAALNQDEQAAQVFDRIASAGLRPVIQPAYADAKRAIRERIGKTGISVPFGALFPFGEAEIFVSGDNGPTVTVRIFKGIGSLLSVKTGWIDLLVEGDAEMQARLEEALQRKLRPHTQSTANTIAELGKKLGSSSPNGKLLARPEIQRAARAVQDDSLRSELRELISAVGANADHTSRSG